jgi:hypothetical protein
MNKRVIFMFNSFGVGEIVLLLFYSCSIPLGFLREHAVLKDVGNGQSL